MYNISCFDEADYLFLFILLKRRIWFNASPNKTRSFDVDDDDNDVDSTFSSTGILFTVLPPFCCVQPSQYRIRITSSSL